MTTLVYHRTRPTAARDRLVLDLLAIAGEIGLNTSSVSEIVIGSDMIDAAGATKIRIGMEPITLSDSDGCVIRNRNAVPHQHIVILPTRTLRKARDPDQGKAAAYRHKILHEFAHCHDLTAAMASPIGKEFDAASRPDRRSGAEAFRLSLVLMARAEYEACRLTASFDSCLPDWDAFDTWSRFHSILEELTLLSPKECSELFISFRTYELLYRWACVAGFGDGGRPPTYNLELIDDLLEHMHLGRALAQFADSLDSLHSGGYCRWQSMSVFNDALAAFKDVEMGLTISSLLGKHDQTKRSGTDASSARSENRVNSPCGKRHCPGGAMALLGEDHFGFPAGLVHFRSQRRTGTCGRHVLSVGQGCRLLTHSP